MKKEIEKDYTKKQTIKILKRLADSLGKNKAFRMQIKNKKVYIPKESEIQIEYEKEKKEEKIEIEIKWGK
ncbi:MAG TPA: amphi-Trp domain-containing protein [Candidatus Paceibacterota bacterium]|nr:amphi-Trp domain-containing protein [Candidatus Paceibacterota bacterium]HPT18203.1 amphi-Trp domain-containing protein [Candidatus Paceibacterota bacterium]